jgi:uncharacterized membrane protein YeaQ/YmgE (transglycosylase-associated protein family)
MSRLQGRVADLERRLERHHEALNYAVDQRDKLILDSSWGIVKAGAFLVSFFAAHYAFENWLGWDGWISVFPSMIVGSAILVFLVKQIAKGEAQDQGKLTRLPEWESRDWDRYE